jgi:hypothetical protein
MKRLILSRKSNCQWFMLFIGMAAAFPFAEADARASEKKGIAMATKDDQAWERLESLELSWFYNWKPWHKSGKPEPIDFIPMVWGLRGNSVATCEELAADHEAGRYTHLLGFNEPDGEKQADLSVAEALEAWPMLESTHLRLGSPGTVHADNEWMLPFMKGVEDRDLRVDFICVHWYGGPNVAQFIRKLEKIHELYDRPIWITEFAIGDWKAKTVEENRYPPKTVYKFMKEALDALEDLDFVERYAWFAAGPDHPALGTSALFHNDGSLTKLGKLFHRF